MFRVVASSSSRLPFCATTAAASITTAVATSTATTTTRRLLVSTTTRRLAASNKKSTPSRLDQNTRFIAWWVPVLGGFVVTCVGGLGYCYHQVGGNWEGLQRTVYFYSFAIPKYVEYRYHLWRQSPDDVWNALHVDTATRALGYVLQLQGFYVKCGQMVAANIGNAFPRIWQDTMSVLQDQCPAQSMETVRQIMQRDGINVDQTFASLDSTPIGAASIGQVHRALLRGDMTTQQQPQPVVVKICYPHVERLLKGDVRTIKLFAQLAQPVHVPALNEVEVQFATEFDYRREAQHMAEIRRNMIRAGLCSNDDENKSSNNNSSTAKCQIPQPLLDHCTKHVLVMTELKGIKLVDALRIDVERQAARLGQSPESFVLQRRRTTLAEFQREAATPEAATHDGLHEIQGPSATQYQQWIALADSQRRLENLKAFVYNTTVGWWAGQSKSYQDKSVLPLNHAQLIDDLFAIHGHQVLVDGLLNGDPHPGNILLCRRPDGSPQLGLIDYGQVKRLSKADRHLFCRLILALAADDREEIIQLTKQAGFVSQRMDPDVIYSYAKVGYDQDNARYTKGLHIQMFMEDLQARDPIAALPYNFIVVSRCTLMLRGLAHALQQPRSVAEAWKPIAERVLRDDL